MTDSAAVLEQIGTQLTAAAETADFGGAAELAHRYRHEFDRVLAAMPAGARARSSLAERALRLHERAVCAIAAARAQRSAEQRRLKLTRPGRSVGTAPDAWQITF